MDCYLEDAQCIELVRRGMPIYSEQTQVGGLHVVVGVKPADIFDNQQVLRRSTSNVLRKPVNILLSDKPRLCEEVPEVLPSAITLPRFASL